VSFHQWLWFGLKSWWNGIVNRHRERADFRRQIGRVMLEAERIKYEAGE